MHRVGSPRRTHGCSSLPGFWQDSFRLTTVFKAVSRFSQKKEERATVILIPEKATSGLAVSDSFGAAGATATDQTQSLRILLKQRQNIN